MEVHMSRLLRNSIILSALAVAIGALACSDTTKPRELATAGIGGPSYTAAVDFTSTVVGRGNLGTFHIQSKAGAYDAELKSHDNTDIVVANIAVAPGGHSGWHFQHGTGMKVPTRMPTGCYGYVRDHDVGVVVRLELGVISTGLRLNVKRAEVAASNDCGRKVHCGRVARPTDSRGRKLSRFRGVAAGERSDGDGERR